VLLLTVEVLWQVGSTLHSLATDHIQMIWMWSVSFFDTKLLRLPVSFTSSLAHCVPCPDAAILCIAINLWVVGNTEPDCR
jgi:hypothetical protein